MRNDNNLPIRLSVSEASKLFGLSDKTIRLALKANELRYVIVRGRYQINFESLIEWSQRTVRRQNILSTGGIGKYIDGWKINNIKYSPNSEMLKEVDDKL